MPRKRIITRKVRRLTPREISYLLSCTVAWEMEQEDKQDWERTEDRKNGLNFDKEDDAMQGLYKDLAIIIEEEV
jgi:hypothetical protein